MKNHYATLFTLGFISLTSCKQVKDYPAPYNVVVPQTRVEQLYYDEIWPGFINLSRSDMNQICNGLAPQKNLSYLFMISAGSYEEVWKGNPDQRQIINLHYYPGKQNLRKNGYFTSESDENPTPTALLDISMNGGYSLGLGIPNSIHGRVMDRYLRFWVAPQEGRPNDQGALKFVKTDTLNLTPDVVRAFPSTIAVDATVDIITKNAAGQTNYSFAGSEIFGFGKFERVSSAEGFKLKFTPLKDFPVGQNYRGERILSAKVINLSFNVPVPSQAWLDTDPLNLGNGKTVRSDYTFRQQIQSRNTGASAQFKFPDSTRQIMNCIW